MTINVICRKDAINRNHLAPLALVFTHDRRRKFVGLSMAVLPELLRFYAALSETGRVKTPCSAEFYRAPLELEMHMDCVRKAVGVIESYAKLRSERQNELSER